MEDKTPRVRLIPVSARDAAEFTAAALASESFHAPWVYLPVDADEFAAYLARFDEVTAHGFVLRLTGTDDLVGYVNISQIVRGSYQRGVLGYGVFAHHARRGYLTEGLALAVRHAFGVLGLHRLEAEIQPGNAASLRLVERLGFTHEGTARALIKIKGVWRDHERWSITNV